MFPTQDVPATGGKSRRVAAMVALWLAGAALEACTAAPRTTAPARERGEVAPSFRVPPKDGEFRRSFAPGHGISCIAGDTARDAAGGGANHCLRLGPLRIGDGYAALVQKLARLGIAPDGAHTVEERLDGTRSVVFPIERADIGRRPRLKSYLVATVDASSRIRRLQVTGVASAATSSLSFSGISLGANRSLVTDVLGLPSSVDDVPEIDGRLWSWSPYPFRIEIVDGRVYAIVVGEPSEDDARRTFVPLESVDD